MSDTKLSCIMVTKRDRVGLAMRAIHNLVGWEHPGSCSIFDPYELIIVHDMEENPFAALPFRIRRNTNCRCVTVPVETPLHERFRRGVKTSEGNWITFLDDDVFYHSMRLTYQMEVAQETPDRPCVFAEGMYYFFDTKELFVVKLAKPTRDLDATVIPYSTVFPKNHFVGFPDKPGHPICNCLRFMGSRKIPITIIRDQWKWVCVGIRGDNLHGYKHFRDRVTDAEISKSVHWLQGMWPEVFGVLGGYNWDGNLNLCGHDGSQAEFRVNTLWPTDLPPIGVPDDDVERIQEDVSDG